MNLSMKKNIVTISSIFSFLVILWKSPTLDLYILSNATYDGSTCNCDRHLPPLGKNYSHAMSNGVVPPDGSYVGPSTCNSFTTYLGSGQNVLSYSYYTPLTIHSAKDMHWFRYLGLVKDLLKSMVSLYPGWRMRIYHNVTRNQVDEIAFLCHLHCNHPYLDLCDVRHVPALAAHADLETTIDMGKAWRFVVMGDPTVRMFGLRDLDSYLLQRERDVVTDWMKRGEEKQFYIMRDTPEKKNKAGYLMPIKGGCWGGNNYLDFGVAKGIAMNDTLTRLIVKSSFWDAYGKTYFSNIFDMVYLREIVWPVINSTVNMYDSFHCKAEELGESLPFPTKREGSLYVGSGPVKYNLMEKIANRACPAICRPKDHQDWIYC